MFRSGCMNTWNLFFAQNWQQRFDFHFTVWESFFRLTKTYFMNIHQLRCKYSNWYALVYLSFSMFLNANIDIHIRKKRYIWIQFLISIIDLLLTGCYEIFNSVVLDLSRRLLLVHFILRRKPTASVSVGEKNINTARISMNS